VEVPRWRREHPCYSCHNNGDAARALLAAADKGLPVGPSLDDTLAWLGRPERWDENAQGGGIDDKPLARIQFAGALTSAVETGRASRNALVTAAGILATDQDRDGSWVAKRRLSGDLRNGARHVVGASNPHCRRQPCRGARDCPGGRVVARCRSEERAGFRGARAGARPGD
jgi:hypothetical protein